jgi:hypothetical protein
MEHCVRRGLKTLHNCPIEVSAKPYEVDTVTTSILKNLRFGDVKLAFGYITDKGQR